MYEREKWKKKLKYILNNIRTKLIKKYIYK